MKKAFVFLSAAAGIAGGLSAAASPLSRLRLR